MNKHGGYNGNGDHLIDYSINVNPFELPNEVINSMYEGIKNIHLYPEVGGRKAIEKLSLNINVNVENLIIGNGATELIYLFARSFKFKQVLIAEPTFSEYRRAFELAGSKVERIVLIDDHYCFDEKKIELAITKKDLDCIVICSPNNPTGKIINYEKLIYFLKLAQENKTWLFIDESFLDFTEEKSLLNVENTDYLFVLKSMTKIFGLPGIRMGYAFASKLCIKKMFHYKEPWTLNAVALNLFSNLDKLNDFGKTTRKYIQQEKLKVQNQLINWDFFDVIESKTNFILCKMRSVEFNALQLQEELLKKGYYIRTCEEFMGLDNQYIRFAIRSSDENIQLLNAIKSIMEVHNG